jgi:aryl-alcohol dehydrogenase-like predicted oxidoreductase
VTEAFERFVLHHADAIARGILSKVSATYQLDPGPDADRAKRLRRRLYPAQLHCAAAIARRLRSHPDALLTGEPSTGKTVTSIAVAWMLQASRVLAVVPAHLLSKWRREILQSLPSAEVVELRRLSDAKAAVGSKNRPGRPLWALVSRDVAKLDAYWAPAVHPRWAVRPVKPLRPGRDLPRTAPIGNSEHPPTLIKVDPETNEPLTVFRCPDCYQSLGQWRKEGTRETWQWWTAAYLEAAVRKCPHCQAVLARRYSRGKGAFPIARYLSRYHPNGFDLAIVDEVHRHKGSDTAQGMALGWVGRAAKRTIGITATLTSGKPGSVFHLLHRPALNSRRHNDRGEKADRTPLPTD